MSKKKVGPLKNREKISTDDNGEIRIDNGLLGSHRISKLYVLTTIINLIYEFNDKCFFGLIFTNYFTTNIPANARFFLIVSTDIYCGINAT